MKVTELLRAVLYIPENKLCRGNLVFSVNWNQSICSVIKVHFVVFHEKLMYVFFSPLVFSDLATVDKCLFHVGHPPDNALPLYFGHFQFNNTMDEVRSNNNICYPKKKLMLHQKKIIWWRCVHVCLYLQDVLVGRGGSVGVGLISNNIISLWLNAT